MTVSICVITYNHVNFIEKTILSLLNQQCSFDFEIVVSDDSSNDGTSEVCLKLAQQYSKIKYFNQKYNIGMMSNFKFAINHCSGDYIALCEGDDYWIDEQKIQKQFTFLEKNREFSVCASYVYIADEINKSNYIPQFKKTVLNYSDFAINGCSGVYTCTMFFKKTRNLIDKINQNWFLNLDGADHFLLLLLTSTGKKVIILNDVTAVYRVHSKGVWTSKYEINRIIDSKKNQLYYLENIRNDSKTKKYFSLSMMRLEYSFNKKSRSKNNYLVKKFQALLYHIKFKFILIKTKL